MFGLGVGELAFILVVILLVFGPRRMPELGEALGKGIRNFRWGLKQMRQIDVTPAQRAEMETKDHDKH